MEIIKLVTQFKLLLDEGMVGKLKVCVKTTLVFQKESGNLIDYIANQSHETVNVINEGYCYNDQIYKEIAYFSLPGKDLNMSRNLSIGEMRSPIASSSMRGVSGVIGWGRVGAIFLRFMNC